MRRAMIYVWLAIAAMMILSACGGSSGGALNSETPKLSGTAASGAPIVKGTTVYVKDSTGKSVSGKISDDLGNFIIDASGLTPPLALCVDTSVDETG